MSVERGLYTRSVTAIANDAIDSEHYVDGSIDTAHLGDLQVTTGKIAADAITSAKIGDDAIDSEHYTDGSIDNAHIADDAIDSEHYAAGSIDLEHMSSQSVDEDNLHISNSPTNGYMLTAQSGDAGGLTWASAGGGGFTLASEQATTSGASVNFGSIPTGTKQIYIMFAGVSSGDADQFGVQIGDAGGIETSGYSGSGVGVLDTTATSQTSTTRFVMTETTAAAREYSGTAILTLEDSSGFTWTFMSVTGSDSPASAKYAGGYKSLSAELTQLTILTSGVDFDAGAINIMYS